MIVLGVLGGVVAWLLVGFAVYAADCRWDFGQGMDKEGASGGLFIVMGPPFALCFLFMGALALLGRLANRLVPCKRAE